MKSLFICIFLLFSGSNLAHPSYGIEIDGEGNIYFADITHNGRGTIWKLDKAGEIHSVFKNFHSHNVNVDQEGRIYVAHGDANNILIRIGNGGRIDTLAYSKDISKFFGGNCSVSPNGVIYFGIDHYIWRLDKDGTVAKASDHYLEWNQGFYVDEYETIYATDIGIGNGSLFCLEKNGRVKLLADQLITLTNGKYDHHADVLRGIKKGPDNHIYLADLADRKIIKVSPGGEVTDFYQSEEGWMPTGIAFEEDNAFILVFGSNNQGPRIIRKPAKSSEIIFDYGQDRFVTYDFTPENNNLWIAILLLLLSCSYFLVPHESKSNIIL